MARNQNDELPNNGVAYENGNNMKNVKQMSRRVGMNLMISMVIMVLI